MSDTEVAHAHAEGGHAHPSDLQYVYIALFLAFVTAAEVAVSYSGWGSTPEILALIPMMIVKFAVVAMFFMHLRFDSKIFRYFFLTGLTFATACYLIILTTFHFWSGG
jgi:heme/copper-type cytochrome/quinol oxidase subunit 4